MSERMTFEVDKTFEVKRKTTVADIKEYAHTIAEYIKNYREVCREEGGDEERIPTTPLQNDIEHLVSMLDELDKPMTNREYMHLVGVKALFDTKFDLDKPLEKDFIEFLYMLEKHKDEWVDVSDRLPSENKKVLVTLLSGKVDVLSLVNIEKYEKERNAKVGNPENFTYFWNTTAYWYKFNEVIAWKPLPKPYERKE